MISLVAHRPPGGVVFSCGSSLVMGSPWSFNSRQPGITGSPL